MPPLEAWEKVLVDVAFFETPHGRLDCAECHGGREDESDMEKAHEGMVSDPSEKCAVCHPSEGASYARSQHFNLTGFRKMISLRAGVDELTPGLESMFQQTCNACHATCGQCHVSRPNSAGKGFVRGHRFLSRPSMRENCTACHGSRIDEEFRGQHSGIPADVHYNKGMQCSACHTAGELHGHGEQGENRYQVANVPRCEDCHEVEGTNTYHTSGHLEKLSCQVCHSMPYKNCYSCHVGQGLDRPSELGFKIGRNPIRSERRPYEYVVLRHIPIVPDSYAAWDPSGLSDFSVMPTWKFATPHNIQKNTPQTADCFSSCHNNEKLFLTQGDLSGSSPEEIQANQSVVVQRVP